MIRPNKHFVRGSGVHDSVADRQDINRTASISRPFPSPEIDLRNSMASRDSPLPKIGRSSFISIGNLSCSISPLFAACRMASRMRCTGAGKFATSCASLISWAAPTVAAQARESTKAIKRKNPPARQFCTRSQGKCNCAHPLIGPLLQEAINSRHWFRAWGRMVAQTSPHLLF